jgi:hypothetical protein
MTNLGAVVQLGRGGRGWTESKQASSNNTDCQPSAAVLINESNLILFDTHPLS